jgi:hypothetical protein
MSTESQALLGEYLQLLNLTYEVAQSLKGKVVSDGRWVDCQQLALKLYSHATTVYWLRAAATKAPVPYSMENGSSFHDFSSITVLTRVIMETYLNLFHVFFEPTTDDDFEYNHALWLLSGFILRENYTPSDPLLQGRIPEERRRIDELKTRLQATKRFKALNSNPQNSTLNKTQRAILRGARASSKSSAKAAGFSGEMIEHLYSFQSSYVHADGLSGLQIQIADTSQDQIEFIETQMQVIMIFLSKMILDYANKFPESKAACDKDPAAYAQAQAWVDAGHHLPSYGIACLFGHPPLAIYSDACQSIPTATTVP